MNDDEHMPWDEPDWKFIERPKHEPTQTNWGLLVIVLPIFILLAAVSNCTN